jgi:mannose-6-phosphate isomerase-like protein (cupin superfamily)
MKLSIAKDQEKPQVFADIQNYLNTLGLRAVASDFARPWGGFFVIDETQAQKFASLFFPHFEFSSIQLNRKLSPKILVVQGHKRLSWQYHHRRAEIWKVVAGEVGVVTSDTDAEGPLQQLKVDDIIELRQGQRHRLVGLDGWGILAEIWQHTDANHPSDEDDIVRVQDDFGR